MSVHQEIIDGAVASGSSACALRRVGGNQFGFHRLIHSAGGNRLRICVEASPHDERTGPRPGSGSKGVEEVNVVVLDSDGTAKNAITSVRRPPGKSSFAATARCDCSKCSSASVRPRCPALASTAVPPEASPPHSEGFATENTNFHSLLAHQRDAAASFRGSEIICSWRQRTSESARRT